jgi:ABC-type phosphate transport system auxiliary subunit
MNSAADIRSRIAEIEHSIAGIESQLASLRADKEQLQLTLSSIVDDDDEFN